MVDLEFELQYRQGYRLTLIDIFYYMPDHESLIQEFVWQTLDLPPRFPRIGKFLEHWRHNIDAVIKEILLCSKDGLGNNRYHKVDQIYTC